MRLERHHKAIFITLYSLGLTAATLYAAYALSLEPEDLAWWGALATTLPFALFLTFVMLTKTIRRTSRHLPFILALGVIGPVLALPSFIADPLTGWPPFLVAAAGLMALISYLYWYSEFDLEKSPGLIIGQPLPPFVVETLKHNPCSSDEFAGSPTLILFYRGNWCPYCMGQVRELATLYPEFSGKGVRLVMISPQPHKLTAKLAAQYDSNIRFLVDAGGAAANALNIKLTGDLPLGFGLLGYDRDTVLPTLILVDEEGIVVATESAKNYRNRPDPREFLRMIP